MRTVVTVSGPMVQTRLRRRTKFEARHRHIETQAVVVIFLGVGGVGAASILTNKGLLRTFGSR